MAHQVYKNAAGKRVPSVTTILRNLGWNKDQLVAWANKEGLEGRKCYETASAAATVGTLAHLGIEADIKGEPYDVGALHLGDEDKERVRRCLQAWHDWRERNKVVMVGSEVALVSELWQFGGCLDVATVWEKPGLLDLKTGGGTYADHLIQVRAYGELWNESHPDQKIEEYHLLRVGKEDASWHHHCYPAEALSLAWEAFRHALALHRLEPVLKKAAA